MRTITFDTLKNCTSLSEIMLDCPALCVTDSSVEYVISRKAERSASAFLSGSDKKLIKRIVEYAVREQTISVSAIQRQFKIGYARACNILEYMEAMGYISSANGIEPRKVFITQSQIDDGIL